MLRTLVYIVQKKNENRVRSKRGCFALLFRGSKIKLAKRAEINRTIGELAVNNPSSPSHPFSSLPFPSQDLKHVFPASRLLISTVTTELHDLNRGYASFKRLVEGDPNLRPQPPEASPKAGGDPPPSPGCLARTSSTSSSGGGGDAEVPELSPSLSSGGSGSGSGSRSEKLATLSRQKTENRKSTAMTGKVCDRRSIDRCHW